MITGIEFARQAQSNKYDGISYDELDCQAFVEKVLKDSGVRKSDGTPYNWTGSNKMWRVALSWKGTISECIKKYGSVPDGAWCFTVKNDGGEKKRGYNDSEGNASHVGIVIGNCVRHSTTGGVQYSNLNEKRWTHIGIPKCIDFSSQTVVESVTESVLEKLDKIVTLCAEVKAWILTKL